MVTFHFGLYLPAICSCVFLILYTCVYHSVLLRRMELAVMMLFGNYGICSFCRTLPFSVESILWRIGTAGIRRPHFCQWRRIGGVASILIRRRSVRGVRQCQLGETFSQACEGRHYSFL